MRLTCAVGNLYDSCEQQGLPTRLVALLVDVGDAKFRILAGRHTSESQVGRALVHISLRDMRSGYSLAAPSSKIHVANYSPLLSERAHRRSCCFPFLVLQGHLWYCRRRLIRSESSSHLVCNGSDFQNPCVPWLERSWAV